MLSINSKAKANGMARSSQISAVITRADGRVEYLGVVSYWHKNPLKRLAWHAKQLFKKWSVK